MATNDALRVVYLTAGAGGMYCGSCLNDNTLAKALSQLGVDIQLVPTYTPITTDEENVSVNEVYFGGINVFLQQKLPWLRWLPSSWDRFLNHPALIRWATKKDVQTNPEFLGKMTVSMLKGNAGFQKKEVQRLLKFLKAAKPDVVNFTNALIAGCAPEIKRQLPHVATVVTLQGDDIFLDYLPSHLTEQAIELIRKINHSIDGFIVHSAYYRDYMGKRLELPTEKVHLVRLGIDIADLPGGSAVTPRAKKRVGYLARLSPEKGLHQLIDAFIQLRQQRDDVELAIAGWVGNEHQEFADEQFAKLQAAGLGEDFFYAGVVDRASKIQFLSELDLLCVPTTYQEPKGRFVLEAMACGVPVVLPDHGAFSELVTASGCGLLVPPHDPQQLAATLDRVLDDPDELRRMGQFGRRTMETERNATAMARDTLEVYQRLLPRNDCDV